MSVSKEAIEAAARALASFDDSGNTKAWGALTDDDKEMYRVLAQVVLTAAAPIMGAHTLRESATDLEAFWKNGNRPNVADFLRDRASAIGGEAA